MADIRINALATTAASTASDDFVAVDGSANGTRKLNAYSPTFGGNLTVSGGKGTFSNSDDGRVAAAGSILITNGNYGSTSTMGRLILSGGGGNNSTQSGWYLGSQNTAGVGGPAPYLDIGLATTDTGTSYGTFTQQLRLTSTTATFAGNLMVSGTGLSSVAGAMKVGGTATFTGAGLELQYVAGGGNYGYFRNYNRTSSVYERLYVDGFLTILNSDSGGNVLIGTTTDGGQKLQVSGTGYFSGSVGIGASPLTPLHVKGNVVSNRGVLMVQDSSGSGASSYPVISFYDSADSERGSVGLYGNDFKVINKISGNLILATNNTTAVTLSSSQNMTVEGTGVHQIKGTLLLGNQAAIGASLDVQTANGTASTFRLFQSGVSNWVWSVPASTDALVLSQYGTTEAMRFNSSRVAIFAGPVRLNNAYTAGAPTATGYVTIQDSAGNTYKVLVGT